MPDDAVRLSTCECGALQMTVTGDPVHVHACTCTRCQRGTGSALRVTAWFPEARVQINGAFTTFYSDGPENLSVMSAFCPVCGGGGFSRTGAYLQGCIAIPVGNFADPGFPAPDHIHWWPDRPHWLGTPEGPDLLPGN